MADKNNIIIIKKVEGDDHGGHHGGGWKVAYADFMTAMMAFFLLMWILASSDESAKRGLADYFTPSLSQSGGRGQGLLDGTVLGKDGVLGGSTGEENVGDLPKFGQENPLIVFDSRLKDETPNIVVEYEVIPEKNATDTGNFDAPKNGKETEIEIASEIDVAALKQVQALKDKQEQRDALLETVREQIEEAIKADPKIADLNKNLVFEIVPEGLLVQMVDHKKQPMFRTGSAKVPTNTREVIQAISQAIFELSYPIEISGHTDANIFAHQTGYDNWDLSTDRANATRRIMVSSGVNPTNITRVSGFADKRLLNTEDPKAPENRRIGILLLYPDPALKL